MYQAYEPIIADRSLLNVAFKLLACSNAGHRGRDAANPADRETPANPRPRRPLNGSRPANADPANQADRATKAVASHKPQEHSTFNSARVDVLDN